MGMGRVSHDVAAKWRATRWWDVDIGDVEVVLWGSPIEIGKQDRIKAVRDRLFRSHLLPAFQMSDAQMDRYLDDIARLRPRMLFGYASALALLAAHAERRGRDLRNCGARVAFATGETLYPAQRDVIERVFGAPGGQRLRLARCRLHRAPVPGGLAAPVGRTHRRRTGRRGGRPVAPGEQGEIVVTHLGTGDFPFIRYRTGDMAVMGTGALRLRTWPAGAARGVRSVHRLRAHGVGQHDARAGADLRGARQARREGVQVHPGRGPIARLAARRRSRTDGRGRGEHPRGHTRSAWARARELTIRRVDEIPPEKSGKYRYVVSKALPPAAAGAGHGEGS